MREYECERESAPVRRLRLGSSCASSRPGPSWCWRAVLDRAFCHGACRTAALARSRRVGSGADCTFGGASSTTTRGAEERVVPGELLRLGDGRASAAAAIAWWRRLRARRVLAATVLRRRGTQAGRAWAAAVLGRLLCLRDRGTRTAAACSWPRCLGTRRASIRSSVRAAPLLRRAGPRRRSGRGRPPRACHRCRCGAAVRRACRGRRGAPT